MSTLTTSEGEVITDAPKAKRTRKPKVTSDVVKLSSVYASRAAAKNIDTTRAAKLVRSKMRSNFDHVCTLSPNIAAVKSSANDGNRWPDTITCDLADYLLGK